ncbi:SGNH/GDSL hydrolase family protein [Streptomyces sp. CA-181903]|uniref:SGNH/GDSL hydrolase family protein n=1 Tax=Streptomyces sp. CA-181903 TaxID=3240055 RepID=UPI003D907460
MACAALLGGLVQAAPAVAAPQAASGPGGGTPAEPAPPGRVTNPDSTLGKDWKSSGDRAVTAAADTGGLRILVADSGEAYEWRAAAVLAEPGLSQDTWIGNQCVMDPDHVAAVYAPRTFTNKPDLMQGGAFAAIVDVTTGAVKKLPFTVSLASFDPSCNTQTRTAAFTAFRDMNDPRRTRTRVVTVDASGKSVGEAAAQGEFTGAVPVEDGAVAASGRDLVHLDRSGKVKRLATGDSVPFDIRPAKGGRIGFVDRKDARTARAKVWHGNGEPAVVASGKLGDIGLAQGDEGRVFLTGSPKGAPKVAGTGVTRIDAPAGKDVSTRGRLAVDPVLTPGVRAGLTRIKDAGKGFTKAEPDPGRSTARSPESSAAAAPLTVTSTATATGKKLSQTVADATVPGGKSPGGKTPSPALPARDGASAEGKATTGKPARRSLTAGDDPDPATDPRDTDRVCAVSRNDIGARALQPTPNQVEWAVDMAVRGQLRGKYLRQGGYRDQAGLGTIDPQGLFPPPTLNGGGRIPANVMLGIMAQESNLWQAEGGAIPGQMGNPLAAVDGYYGHKIVKDDPASYWQIHWDKSDCGYGVGQVTDGMRLAGFEKDKEKSLSPALQKLVAIDYATNVAASMKILADKWNEVHTDGQKITVNNDDPSRVENWFTAVWNYNLGFNPPSEAGKNGGHWGLGWYNNPANPLYAKSWGHPFMDTDVDGSSAVKDAAHPQDWPYEEKVMGWAAWSIDTGFSYTSDGRQQRAGESQFSTAGYRPAWWKKPEYRSRVTPPLEAFCNSTNGCDPNVPPKCPDEACYRQFWWNQPNVTWKPDCADTCGIESIKYESLVPEPGSGRDLQYGTPVCTGAMPDAKVVAAVPDGTETWTKCGKVKSAGTFQFRFNGSPGDGVGHQYGDRKNYQGKADLHSDSSGYVGHSWYAHTRNAAHGGGNDGPLTITGVWSLQQKLGWARVRVYLPDTGAQTKHALYTVLNTDSTSPDRYVAQRAGRWVSLGVFHFTGQPMVALSNATKDGTADEDIAWDTIEFQELPRKPQDSVVAMGDSFSSGEGASDGDADYYPESNYRNNDPKQRDACHRSRKAWSRQATLPWTTKSVGDLDDSQDPNMDYHLIACSGARTYNVRHDGVYNSDGGEMPQMDKGYLDNNTTLVTISIGGNDSRFAYIVEECMKAVGDGNCKGKEFGKLDRDDKANKDLSPQDKDYIGSRDAEFLGKPMEEAVPGIIDRIVRPDIEKTLLEIHDRAPNAKIVLMGYPPLFSDNGSCLNKGIPGLPGIGLSEASAAWLNSVAPTLTAAMKKATTDAVNQGAQVVFSDPTEDFAGKAVCGDPEQIHAVVTKLTKSDKPVVPGVPVGLSAQSFHPKIGGARLYADALEKSLQSKQP